jgi:hypothetical protein
MATVKKNIFIEAELSWAEEQLASWKAYIDKHPMENLTDRMSNKVTKTGGIMPMVIASIEQQGKYIQDTMKNYLALLKEVDLMRSQEEAKKIASFGDKDITMFEQGDI